jgi:hypothetical protein
MKERIPITGCTRTWVIVLVLALTAWSGCANNNKGLPLPSDTVADGSDVVPPPDTDPPTDTEPPTDTDPPPDVSVSECEPTANGKMPTYCPCAENTDCETGYCIPSSMGKVCTDTCIVDCPDSWSCELVSGLGGDTLFLCIPKPLLLRGHLMGDGFNISADNGQFFVYQSIGTPRFVGESTNGTFTVTPGLPNGGK